MPRQLKPYIVKALYGIVLALAGGCVSDRLPCTERAWPVGDYGSCPHGARIEIVWAHAGSTPAALDVNDDGDWTRGVAICRCPSTVQPENGSQ